MDSSCEVLVSQSFPSISEIDDFRTTYIANCVINSLLCYNVFMFNIVTIHAIRRTLSLPKTLKTLLVSLAVSDVGVGLLGQPLYISLLVNGLQEENPSCNTWKFFDIMMGLFPTTSFLGVVAVSVDRFLAIQFHLRYQELVTNKRVVALVISIWLISVSFSLITVWVPSYIKFLIFCVGGIAGLLLSAVAYLKVYFVVQRHKNQIQALQVQQATQTSEMQSFASLRKSAVGVFYVFILFLLCYLPFFICLAAIKTANSPNITLKRLYLFSYTLVFLNSSLNPVIYCWKMWNIRHAVMDILQNMFCHKNYTSD